MDISGDGLHVYRDPSRKKKDVYSMTHWEKLRNA